MYVKQAKIGQKCVKVPVFFQTPPASINLKFIYLCVTDIKINRKVKMKVYTTVMFFYIFIF